MKQPVEHVSGSQHIGLHAGDLIRREYRPCEGLENELVAYLKAAVAGSLACRCSLWIQHLGRIQVSGDRRQLSVDFSPVSQERRTERQGAVWPIEPGGGQAARQIRPEGRHPNLCMVPVVYSGELLGELNWQPVDVGGQLAVANLFEQLAHRLALHVHRDRLLCFSSRFLKQHLALVGASEGLVRVEAFVERAAAADLPVLIEGEFGTERVQVACALHYASPERGGPLVEVRCLSQQPGSSPGPSDWFEQAQGGTLFFNGLEDLHPELQAQLSGYLESRISQWVGGGTKRVPAVRVIASTTGNLRELVERGGFSKILFAELSFLTVKLPPLRQRRSDITHLVQYILERYGHPAGEAGTEPAAMELLEAYDWPQNVFEMERVLGRLVAMRCGRKIRIRDIEDYAPRLAVEVSQLKQGRLLSENNGDPCPAPARATCDNDNGCGDVDDVPVEQLAQAIVEGDISGLASVHISVKRALRHIGENFQDEITLGELAASARVSPSHLCFLFKTSLGITFKTLLGMVRIEKAKQLLVENPQDRITDISLEVGFGDLSHFEKTFKRIVEVSPRDYRRRSMGEF